MSERTVNLSYPQQAFVEDYLRDPKPKALLLAPPGTGKTITAIHLARRLVEQGEVDDTLVIADKAVVLEQWSDVAIRLGAASAESGVVAQRWEALTSTAQSLRYPEHASALSQAIAQKRLFIVVDDTTTNHAAAATVVGRLLAANSANKALVIARTVPEWLSFDEQFGFDSEFILDVPLIHRLETQVQVARFSPSLALLDRLQTDGQRIDDLSPREFEKFIAELLQRDGYEVILSRGTKDGGVDIVAKKELPAVGVVQTIWQAKRNAAGRKVGIAVIRELADTRNELGASKAIIVTSGYLTRGALDRIQRDKYLLGKIDRGDLNAWIQRLLRSGR